MEAISYGPRELRLDATFTALAHPTRRAILARLAGGPLPVGALAEPFAMSQPAISSHLKVLGTPSDLFSSRAARDAARETGFDSGMEQA